MSVSPWNIQEFVYHRGLAIWLHLLVPTYTRVDISDCERERVLARTSVEVIHDILDERAQLFGG